LASLTPRATDGKQEEGDEGGGEEKKLHTAPGSESPVLASVVERTRAALARADEALRGGHRAASEETYAAGVATESPGRPLPALSPEPGSVQLSPRDAEASLPLQAEGRPWDRAQIHELRETLDTQTELLLQTQEALALLSPQPPSRANRSPVAPPAETESVGSKAVHEAVHEGIPTAQQPAVEATTVRAVSRQHHDRHRHRMRKAVMT
jgi:hypothetical protein